MKFFKSKNERTKRAQYIEQILHNFYEVKRSISCADKRINNEAGLGTAQRQLLMRIRENPRVTTGEIAERVGISRSAVTQLVDSLVAQDLVQRVADENDRRVVRLTLTKKSQKQSAEFDQQIVNSFIEHFAALTDEELAEYARLMDKIANAKETNETHN